MFRLRSLIAALSLLVVLAPPSANAADPCAGDAARSLVLGSGGSKGAFEAGAVYHLVIHRGCDFTEISGNSVGALNGAILAQAARTSDRAQSLANMRAAAEKLVAEWDAIRSARDMMRSRPLAKLRFAFVGLDSIRDFGPLRDFIGTRVDLERLAAGRELRVGVLSFTDGRYHEMLLSHDGVADPTAQEFVFASALVPVFSRMPMISPPGGGAPLQFGDGGVRHATPVTSYFERCAASSCLPLTGVLTPPHPRTEQLFVVVTSAYSERNDLMPVFNPKAIDPRTGAIEDGRKILVRMFDLMVDTMHRTDLDDMLLYNDVLAWQARQPGATSAGFPIASFNREAPGAPPQPYEIALIAPERDDSDPLTMFNADPKTQRERVLLGCLAADKVMTTQFRQASMADKCVVRFPKLTGKQRRGETAGPPTATITP